MNITQRALRGGAGLLAVGTLLSLSGCLIMGSAKQERTGNYVSDATLARIEPGKTTAGWVIATLGEPDTRSKVEDDRELWRWNYKETRTSNAAVFLLFGGSDEKETSGSAFLELKDGIVVNKWRG